MVAVDVGPGMRWVRVLRAAYRSSVTVAVCRTRPLPADHLLLSGLWFHSHSGPRAAWEKSSVPPRGFTRPAPQGKFGKGYDEPQLPLVNVTEGQPLLQVTGASTGMRPAGYESLNAM